MPAPFLPTLMQGLAFSRLRPLESGLRLEQKTQHPPAKAAQRNDCGRDALCVAGVLIMYGAACDVWSTRCDPVFMTCLSVRHVDVQLVPCQILSNRQEFSER